LKPVLQSSISLWRNASSHERSKATVNQGRAFFMTVKSQYSRQSNEWLMAGRQYLFLITFTAGTLKTEWWGNSPGCS
jgi:hypothetical protein